MKTIISGSNHFIIPKKIVATTCMVGAAFFVGTYISEHMHYRQNEQFIRAKNLGVQESNSKLLREKIAYESIFDELKDHLADWEKGRDMSLVEQAEHVTSFHEQARELLNGLKSMQDLLEEKEFQLWEKEGLLEYQEERLMNTEDLEMEMAGCAPSLAISPRDSARRVASRPPPAPPHALSERSRLMYASVASRARAQLHQRHGERAALGERHAP